MTRHVDERGKPIKLIHFMWGVGPWRWAPDGSRTWRDHVTGYRFRVVKWGWWAWYIRRDRKVPDR